MHLHANIVNSSHFPDMQQALKDGFLRTDAELLRRALGHAPSHPSANALWFHIGCGGAKRVMAIHTRNDHPYT